MANNQDSSNGKMRQSSGQRRAQVSGERKEEKPSWKAPALTDDNYVDSAEKVIKILSERKDSRGNKAKIVTTTQIRNLLAMTADIYNDIMEHMSETLDPDTASRIEYLRVHFIYESGRTPEVKDLVETADLIPKLKSAKNSRKDYILFSRYMEALVAFRKYIGNDK